MDFIANLPSPLPLAILTAIEDFSSLYNLTMASPDAYRAVRMHGSEILNEVAEKCLSFELQYFLHLLATVRSRGLPPDVATADNFIDVFFGISSGIRWANWTLTQVQSSILPTSISGELASGLLSSAANIDRLTSLVLEEFMARTRALRPAYPDARKLWLPRGHSPPVDEHGWPVAPQGSYLHVKDDLVQRQPGWVEMYRVRRALWDLQIALEVAPALAETPDDTGSVAGELIDHAGFYRRETIGVARCLEDIAGKLDRSWPLPCPPLREGQQVTDPAEGRRQGISPSYWKKPDRNVYLPRLPRVPPSTCLPLPVLHGLLRDDVTGRARGKYTETPLRPNDAAMAARSAVGRHRRGLLTKAVTEEDFPSSGLYIWDAERLAGLRLPTATLVSGEEAWPYLDADAKAYVWWSVSSDGAAEMTRRAAAREEEG